MHHACNLSIFPELKVDMSSSQLCTSFTKKRRVIEQARGIVRRLSAATSTGQFKKLAGRRPMLRTANTRLVNNAGMGIPAGLVRV
jgi:hypothetical protein